MTQEELESVLIPGAKLESFIIDPKRVEELIKQTHERQKAILKQKEIDWEKARNTFITI